MKKALLFILGVLFVSNIMLAQKVTLDLNQVKLEEVFASITKQTGFTFAYTQPTINAKEQVSISMNGAELNVVLKELFKNSNVSYEIRDNRVFLSDKTTVTAQKSSDEKITVTGIISDASGEGLIGATVQEKGGAGVSVTDFDGRYSVTVSSTSTLVVSYLGFVTKEVTVNKRKSINIEMADDSKALAEVVVTALGIKRDAKALGYGVVEVKSDALTAGHSDNAINALSGKMAGVDISTGSGGPAGSSRVIIRGVSQLSGSNQPLYVIDGVPMDNTTLGSAGKDGGYDLGDGMSSLNPEDIESISVLKGSSAAALYGSRAGNGVILITTKSGKGQKGLGVELSMNVTGVVFGSGFNDYQREYGQGTNGLPPYLQSNAQTSTQSAWGGKLDPNLTFPIYNGEMKNYENRNDNILSFFRTGVTYTNSVAVSHGSEKGNFRASVSDLRNNDIVPTSGMNRTTVMIKGDYDLSDRLRIEARGNYSREKVNNRPALSDSPNNIGNSIIGLAPNFDQSWLSNGYKDEYGRYNSWNANQWRLNPYWVINEMSNTSTKSRTMGHLLASYKIAEFLSVQARVGIDDYTFKFSDFVPQYTDGILDGKMSQLTTSVTEINYDAMVRYNQKFLEDKLDINAFVGGAITQYKLDNFGLTGYGQSLPDVMSIRNYSTYDKPASSLIKKDVHSLFGSLSVGYNNFLYGELTVRTDNSSTLAPDYNVYTYPSVSGSFIFSELVDLSKLGLSMGKFRASWAKVGNDTDPYMLYQAYGLGDYTMGGLPLGMISSEVMPNQLLKPTSTYSYEFGLDLRFLNNRLNFDFGYYNKRSVDQIMRLPLSSSTGYKSAIINSGEIINKGIELSVNAIPVTVKNFEWSTNVNLAVNKNIMEELHPDVKYYQLADARWAGASVAAIEGERFGSIIGKKFARNENGDVIYNDQGLPTLENNVSILGNGTYDFTLGFGNSFRYKDFSLGVLLDMKFGGDLYSMSARGAHLNGTSEHTLAGRAEWYKSEDERRAANKTVDQWTPTGGYVGQGVVEVTDADGKKSWAPNTTAVDPQKYWQHVGDSPEPFIYDASYIKLREVNITYNIPTKVLAKTPFRSVAVSAYGRNLWVIHSNVDNIDPESNYNNGNGQGLEYGSLPTRRTFGLGINVKF